MKIANNSLSAVKNRFFEKLGKLYSDGEIEAQFFYALEGLLGYSRTDFLVNKSKLLSESELLQFINVLDRLFNHEPIQHVLGYAWFYDLKLKVNKDVLVPRQETEELVHWVLQEKGVESLLDIGTGSGCIPLALKKNRPAWNVEGLDVSASALKVATENAIDLGLDVRFTMMNILEEQPESHYDIIVSNPPYIPIHEKALMDRNVAGVDPDSALFVPNDSALLFYDVIADWAKNSLKPNGRLFFEIHEFFGLETSRLLEQKGFHVELRQDINGKDRMIKAVLK